jgi:hypothetical protein
MRHQAKPSPSAEVDDTAECAIKLFECSHRHRIHHLLVKLRVRFGGLQTVLHRNVGLIEANRPVPRRGGAPGIDIYDFHALAGKAHRVISHNRSGVRYRIGLRRPEFQFLETYLHCRLCSGARETIGSMA